MRILLRLAVWTLVGGLVFVTLSPLDLRPTFGPATLDRSLAYALFGLVAALAYPRHRVLVFLGVVALAGLLEAGQALTPTRHGRVPDFLVKSAAACAGAILAFGLSRIARRPADRASDSV